MRSHEKHAKRESRKNESRPFAVRAVTVVCLLFLAYGAEAQPVIAAYQEIYRMNFEAASQEGLPAGWYVTGDGYPVAQVSPNHWVYGRVDALGMLVPTEVTVGSVVPMNMPELARITVHAWSGRISGMEKFGDIARSGFDNIGVLDEPFSYTPVAWGNNKAGLMIWIGDRWYEIRPRVGQSTSRAMVERYPYIVRTLREKNAVWTAYDTEELADQAREWGILWRGLVRFRALPGNDYFDSGSEGEPQPIDVSGGVAVNDPAPGNTGGGDGGTGSGVWDGSGS